MIIGLLVQIDELSWIEKPGKAQQSPPPDPRPKAGGKDSHAKPQTPTL